MPIPHVIHQIWLQGKDHIAAKYLPGLEAWKQVHAGWGHILWDDRSIRELLSEHSAWFLPMFCAYRHLNQRVDSARYFILYQHGGVYADIDTEPIRPLDLLLSDLPDVSLIVPKQSFSDFERCCSICSISLRAIAALHLVYK